MRALLAWELGGSFGHMMNLRPLAQVLNSRGHDVFIAANDLWHAPTAFNLSNVTLLSAPWNKRLTKTAERIITYADLLLNVSFGDRSSLGAHLAAWRNLFALVNPDLLVCDHSPTAILAAKGAEFSVATIGTGFFTPVDESPLRLMLKVDEPEERAAREREGLLLDIINSALAKQRIAPMERVAQLYHDSRTKHFIVTYPELDHFVGRIGGDYRGPLPYGLPGESFVRRCDRPNVFAYLKLVPALEVLVQKLASAPFHTTLYVDGITNAVKEHYHSDRLTFANGPIDIRQAAEACDLALTNANPGTCTAMLLAGKPLVNVPLFLEQSLFAGATDRLGASLTVAMNDAGAILGAINQVLADTKYKTAAAAFANRHKNDDLDAVAPKIVDDLEEMMTER